ncbi:uncharacterized protein LOC127096418 [Lathyrus oleraceus]|uniref:uncharacterized protein LOC127096418 n=1 Tax=Pisum sativum TaxID=3888 RepID=UPI0021D3740E|nr:uncharacterized protein LOC127096418 [Pisum sativum]
MEILYSEKDMILHHLKYELELLKRFELKNCKTAIIPIETNHKLDYDVEVGMVCRFMNKPKWSHYQVVVKILRFDISTSEYFFKYLGGLVSWFSEKQPLVALSTCKDDYIVDDLTVCQAIGLMNLLQDLKIKVNKPMKLMIDNKSAIRFAKNPMLHGRSKHIYTKLCTAVLISNLQMF